MPPVNHQQQDVKFLFARLDLKGAERRGKRHDRAIKISPTFKPSTPT